jgi:DNA-directed RNA polymerase subunit RPC12/RpoP
MDDTIEICSGCGKMPRAIDLAGGQFSCSRCGNKAMMAVKSDDYERVVTELDQRFHSRIQKQRIEAAASHPVDMGKPGKRQKPAKKAAKTKVARKKPSKKRK